MDIDRDVYSYELRHELPNFLIVFGDYLTLLSQDAKL